VLLREKLRGTPWLIFTAWNVQAIAAKKARKHRAQHFRAKKEARLTGENNHGTAPDTKKTG